MKCETSYCRNSRVSGRKKCWKCFKRIWRVKYPLKAQYTRLKTKAKERNIAFTISLQEFTDCVGQDYPEKTGIYAMCLTIDRIDNLLGYIPGNIQTLSKSENSIKRCKQDQMRMQNGYKWRENAI